MPKVLVLGSGLVGSVIAADLAGTRGFRVTVADRDEAPLAAARRRARRVGVRLSTTVADCGRPTAVRRLAKEFDLVVGALPSRLGFDAVRAVVEAGRPCCDISFMEDDPEELDELARRRGVPVVVDCGVAPGLSHMLAAVGVERLDRADLVDIMVGGLPRHRAWPYEYKAGFAPHDVIEEYVRPARFMENGEIVVREALSEPELVEFPGVGTLEAFNTDGLRTLLRNLPVPTMRERTLRYPGHIDLMRVLRETGLFGLEPIEVGKAKVRPRDLVAKLLFPMWTFEEDEPDLTAMRVAVEGELDGRPTRLEWNLLDHHDAETGFSSMSRTTGFVATSVARLVGTGLLAEPGVHAPEKLPAMEGVVDSVMRQLGERGVQAILKVLVADRPKRRRSGGTTRSASSGTRKTTSKRSKAATRPAKKPTASNVESGRSPASRRGSGTTSKRSRSRRAH